ncbi:hypothetical protein [Comamonas odontotermitis]|uniref:hypothetical protein n=1 Tax=Comamonas odontotermitis TaxID=379895 RepID=UPI00161A8FE1|nr:hypothetical protein [Comamonas odontotermitis]
MQKHALAGHFLFCHATAVFAVFSSAVFVKGSSAVEEALAALALVAVASKYLAHKRLSGIKKPPGGGESSVVVLECVCG